MMKTGVAALGALSLFNLASAKPNGHHRRHQQLHEKREDVVVYETDYTYVTAQGPNVVVYADENGVPFSTSTEGQAPATSAAPAVVASSAPVYTEAAAQPAASSSTEIYVAPSPTTFASVYNKAASSKDSTTQAPAYSSPAASSSAATSSKAAASSSAASSGSGDLPGYGIAYSPYQDNGNCKTQDMVNSDFEKIMSYASSNGVTYDYVRLYGADCSGTAMVLNVCEQHDLKIFAGIFNVADEGRFENELQQLITDVKSSGNDWSKILAVSVGNEIVNNGFPASQVAGKISSARSTLSAAGYSGKMVSVDTAVAMMANAEALCKASDFIAVNAHPFFDGNTVAADSGKWLLNTMQSVSSACGGSNVYIAETGWPTQGIANNEAVPSVENQKAALDSMKSAVTSSICWFTPFNDMWKVNTAALFWAEQYWGMIN